MSGGISVCASVLFAASALHINAAGYQLFSIIVFSIVVLHLKMTYLPSILIRDAIFSPLLYCVLVRHARMARVDHHVFMKAGRRWQECCRSWKRGRQTEIEKSLGETIWIFKIDDSTGKLKRGCGGSGHEEIKETSFGVFKTELDKGR